MRGFADIHAHPMAHLAFGGHLISGKPDGAAELALAPCDGSTHGAHSTFDFPFIHRNVAKSVIDGIMQSERESSWMWRTWDRQPPDHPRDGFPTFHGWPFAGTMCHQQFHIEWLRRAYEGGLRLMSCLAVNNRVIGWLMENGRECWDDETIRAQIAEMRRIAADPANSPWMEIAYSSRDAERIIASDKLAVVLGAEVDQIELFLSHDPAVLAGLEEEARRYLSGEQSSAPGIQRLAQTIYDVGIRQINPVHFSDNSFGGNALYFDRHATNIHWLNLWKTGRPAADDGWPVVTDGPTQGPENIEFRMQRMQLVANRGWSIFHPPLGAAADIYGPTPANHVNSRGLTKAGEVFLKELWRRGILVDIDHLSMRAKDSALTLAEHFDVPVISSHCWIRDITFTRNQIGMPDDWWNRWDGKTPTPYAQPSWPMLRHEGMRTYDDLQRIAKLGGIVGSLLRQPAVHKSKELRYASVDGVEVMGTTTAAAAAYLRIVEVLGVNTAVAIGSDVNGLAQSPVPSPCCSPAAFDPYGPMGLKRHRTGDRVWDINADGVAHYGMLPDLIYRWRAEGMRAELLSPLFRSAEGYVATWARAESAARRAAYDPGRRQAQRNSAATA